VVGEVSGVLSFCHLFLHPSPGLSPQGERGKKEVFLIFLTPTPSPQSLKGERRKLLVQEL